MVSTPSQGLGGRFVAILLASLLSVSTLAAFLPGVIAPAFAAGTITVDKNLPQGLEVNEDDPASASVEMSFSGGEYTAWWEMLRPGASEWEKIGEEGKAETAVSDPSTSSGKILGEYRKDAMYYSETGTQYRLRAFDESGTEAAVAGPMTVTVKPRAPEIALNKTEIVLNEGDSGEIAASGVFSGRAQIVWARFPSQGTSGQPTFTNKGVFFLSSPGKFDTTFPLTNISWTQNGDRMIAVLVDEQGKTLAQSEYATLYVNPKTEFTKHPQSVTVAIGDSASFDAAAKFTGRYGMRWFVDKNDGKGFQPVSPAPAANDPAPGTQRGEISGSFAHGPVSRDQNGWKYQAALVDLDDNEKVIVKSDEAIIKVIEPKLSMSVTPSIKDGKPGNAGDVIGYQIVVSNPGDLPAKEVQVTLKDPRGNDIPVTCPATSIDANKSITCEASYTIKQEDVDSISSLVVTTADVTGKDSKDQPIVDITISNPPAKIAQPAPKFAVTTVPTVNEGSNQRPDKDETVTYTFTITNDGNVTLRDVTVSGPGLANVKCEPAGPVAPNGQVTCTTDHVITQEELDEGQVDPIKVSVTGTQPDGKTKYAEAVDVPAVPLKQVPSWTTGTPTAVPNKDVKLGDEITYTIPVTNDGNVTLTDLKINVPGVPEAKVNCPATPLAPGQTVNCTIVYTVTRDDMDNGEVDINPTVTVTTPDPDNPGKKKTETKPVDEVPSVPTAKADPKLTVTGKVEVVDVDKNGRDEAGDKVEYTFTVINDGNVTISDIELIDPKLGPITCQADKLAPGASTTCTVTYVITQDDIDTGKIESTVKVTGKEPRNGDLYSTEVNTQVELKQVHKISVSVETELNEDQNGNGKNDPGDKIEFTFTITNEGNTTVKDVTITDPILGEVRCELTLKPGESGTCKAIYTISGDDQNRGKIVLDPSFAGIGPSGERISLEVSGKPKYPSLKVEPAVKPRGLPKTGSNGAAALLFALLIGSSAAFVRPTRKH